MKLKLFPSTWSILPTELAKLESSYTTYAKEASFDADDVGQSTGSNISIVDDIGTLHIEGIITQKSDIFTSLFGGAPLDVLTEDLKSLIADPDIKTIVLNVDSPGGTIAGVQDFANLIFEAREQKTIISISSSIMTSAAMWIGAAAEHVLISCGTVTTGSIGVLTTHVDISGLEADLGIKTTEITAGRFKRIASSFAPLTDAGRSELQSQVDKIMEAFVSDIARFRNTSDQDVKSNMADGKIFIGDNAVKAGLVDAIVSGDDLPTEIQKIRRTKSLDLIALPGYEALIGAARADENMDVGEVAIKIIKSENTKIAEEKRLSTILNVPEDAVCDGLKSQWETDLALRDEFENYERYEAYFAHAQINKS